MKAYDVTARQKGHYVPPSVVVIDDDGQMWSLYPNQHREFGYNVYRSSTLPEGVGPARPMTPAEAIAINDAIDAAGEQADRMRDAREGGRVLAQILRDARAVA